MRCRESLIAFTREASSVVEPENNALLPKANDFKGWAELIANTIVAGASAERHRRYLKSAAKSTWELVNWLTHTDNAVRFDAYFAFQATGHVLSSWSLSLLRFECGDQERCPRCGSYRLASDYRHDGINTLHIMICTACQWGSEPILLDAHREETPG